MAGSYICRIKNAGNSHLHQRSRRPIHFQRAGPERGLRYPRRIKWTYFHNENDFEFRCAERYRAHAQARSKKDRQIISPLEIKNPRSAIDSPFRATPLQMTAAPIPHQLVFAPLPALSIIQKEIADFADCGLNHREKLFPLQRLAPREKSGA